MKRITKFCICLLTVALATSSAYAKPENTKGYEKSIELTGGFGLSQYTKYSLGVSMMNGYRVNPYFYVGAGIGFRYSDLLYYTSWNGDEHYKSFDGKYLIQPWLRLKGNMTATKFSPYVVLDAGWTFDVGQNPNKNAKGLFFEPQLGMDFHLQGKQVFYFTIGVNLQDYQCMHFNTGEHDPGTSTSRYYVGTLAFHLGFQF